MSTLVVGIDEVGYGPILGPLVVTSCSFLVENISDIDFWKALENSVSKQKKGLGDRLQVADSKKVFSRKKGVSSLERSVLTFLNQLVNLKDKRFSQFLSLVSSDAIQQISTYPWSKDIYEALPPVEQKHCELLSNNLKEKGISFVDTRCCYYDVEKFNLIVNETNNKASLVLSIVVDLIQKAIDLSHVLNIKKIIIYCDRLGGRTNYAPLVDRIEGYKVDYNVSIKQHTKIILRSTSGSKEVEVNFEVGADDKYFPVSLSSMIAKFIREMIMSFMNKYFMNLSPDLKPTAGYWTDGLRFLEDLDASGILDKSGLKINQLVRLR